jgi:hypothetical protein
MDWLKFLMIEESMEEVAGRKTESTLEEWGKHHNLLGIGCRDVFPSSRTPLEHGAIREKAICNYFANFALICNGLLKKVWMWSGHGGGRSFVMAKDWSSVDWGSVQMMESAMRRKRNGGGESG